MEGDIGRFVVCNKIFFAQKAGGGRRNNYVAQVDFNLAKKSIQDGEIFALEFKPATELQKLSFWSSPATPNSVLTR